MTDDPAGGNHMTEGLHRAGAEAARLAGAVLVAVQALIRAEQRRQEAQADLRTGVDAGLHDRGPEGADRGEQRQRWAPAFDERFAGATTDEAADVWAAAQAWSDTDPAAAQAQRRAEARLAELHPQLMEQYQAHQAEGLVPLEAMAVTCSAAMATKPDVGAAEAARSVAQEERGEALQDFSRSDVTATPGVDERATAAAHGADHQELSDARQAQAESLVSQAYPQTIQEALTKRSATSAPLATPFIPGVGHGARRAR